METKNKSKILIADDSEMNRSILLDMLEEEYEIVEAEDGTEAVAALQQLGTEIALVLLDIVMPKLDGFGVLAMMNKYHWIEDIPVIIISAESSSTYLERAFELGVTDYISRPFDNLIVQRRVTNTILLYVKQKRLFDMVADIGNRLTDIRIAVSVGQLLPIRGGNRTQKKIQHGQKIKCIRRTAAAMGTHPCNTIFQYLFFITSKNRVFLRKPQKRYYGLQKHL